MSLIAERMKCRSSSLSPVCIIATKRLKDVQKVLLLRLRNLALIGDVKGDWNSQRVAIMVDYNLIS